MWIIIGTNVNLVICEILRKAVQEEEESNEPDGYLVRGGIGCVIVGLTSVSELTAWRERLEGCAVEVEGALGGS
jgi:hypothetical protein